MVNAQEWLDQNYPPEGKCIRETENEGYDREGGWNNKGKKRAEITKLDIKEQKLKGNLKLEGFTNLESLDCSYNELTSLEIIDSSKLKFLLCYNNKLVNLDINVCFNLKKIWCYNNLLTEPVLVQISQNEELEDLIISDNNFPAWDLSFLSHLVKLYRLEIGNIMKWERVDPGIYNHFSGSLKPLKNLTQLSSLEIDNTDLNSGLEYLPFSLNSFSCLADKRENAKVKELETKLKNFGGVGHDENFIHLLNEWRKVNCEFIFDTLQKTIEELKKENTELEEKNTNLEEEFQEERKIAEDSAKAMDNFYRQNPPREDLSLQNILQEISVDYLTTHWENKQLKKENEQLADSLKVVREFEAEVELKNKTSETKLQKDIQELQASKQKFQNLSIFSFSLLGLVSLIFLLSKWRKINQNRLEK